MSSIDPTIQAAEEELHDRIKHLQAQLQSATEALHQLHVSSDCSSRIGDSDLSKSSGSLATTDNLPPPGKRGYLFKWQDRSVGWSGTKWELRFVTLQRGRLSYYRSHQDDSPRYELSLRGCAVRDDGLKRNRRHVSKLGKGVEPPVDEPGAYFHVFSIYQRADAFDAPENSEVSDIIPLLRFSTPSSAEKSQWINLIARSCAYCETDAFLTDEAARMAELERQRQQQITMANAMPEATPGTLPPLYFASEPRKQHARRPSFSKQPESSLFRTKSGNLDADKLEARSRKSYPHSKPMHRVSEPSYLSAEAPLQNYRGFFNLAMIILVVSNFRLILHTVRQHGFVFNELPLWEDFKNSNDPWKDFPFVYGFLLLQVFIGNAYAIERFLSQNHVNSIFGMIIHHINAHTCLVSSCFIVWNFIEKPAVGGTLLFLGVMTWMKLVSYFLANEDYRLNAKSKKNTAIAMIENLDPGDENIIYPMNITLWNIYYFWLAPTLTYQIAFPKTRRIRIWKVIGILLRMVLAVVLSSFILAQVVTPTLNHLVKDLEATNGAYTYGILAEYWLKLSIANTYLWLLMFYFFFHLYLNLFAELLRFGDRVFYKDWWNSADISSYWRLWNVPVHCWLVRHIYFPVVRHKLSKTMATFVVFFLSAVLHEVLVSVPFHMVRPWSFLGMMMQMPLVAITKFLYRRFPGSSIGNIIFWIAFCVVGQPMAIMLYTVDYQYGKQAGRSLNLIDSAQGECQAWGGQCLPSQ